MGVSPSCSSISPGLGFYFANITSKLEALSKEPTKEIIETAFQSFETLYNRFEREGEVNEEAFRKILDILDQILFLIPIEKMEEDVYEVTKKNGHKYLNHLIGHLKVFPLEERAARKIHYLLWIAKTYQRDEESPSIILPYYVQILYLSKKTFNAKCRESFFQFYETLLEKSLPHFRKKLADLVKHDLDPKNNNENFPRFLLAIKMLGIIESWGIRKEILQKYAEVAENIILTHTAKNNIQANEIADDLAEQIHKHSIAVPQITPLEWHVLELENYRERFKKTFNDSYNLLFESKNQDPISKKVWQLQNVLFENFLKFYREVLIEKSPFSFWLPCPPPHEIQFTGSMGRKEPSLYSDLELFILIEEEGLLPSFYDHLNLELQELKSKKRNVIETLKGKEKSIPIEDDHSFFVLDALYPQELSMKIDALNQELRKPRSEGEKDLDSKQLIQKRLVETFKEKLIKYHNQGPKADPELLKQEIEEMFDLLRRCFKVTAKQTTQKLIQALTEKELFTPKTSDFLNQIFSGKSLEGQSFAYFKDYLFLLSLTCSAFGEGPPPQTIGLEEEDVIGKRLYLDIPEEGPNLMCRTGDTYVNLQKREVCYTLDSLRRGIPFEYSLLKSSSFYEDAPLYVDYKKRLNEILDQKLQNPLPGMEIIREQRGLQLLAFRSEKFPPPQPRDLINLKTDYIEQLYHPLSDLGFYLGFEKPNTLELLDELIKAEVFTKESGELLKEIVAALYMIRTRCQIQSGEDEGVLEKNSAGKSIIKKHHFTSREKDYLDMAYWLGIKPLHRKLNKLSTIHSSNLKRNPKEELKKIDLLQEEINDILGRSPQPEDFGFIRPLFTYLLKTKGPLEKFIHFYKLLSTSSLYESLRKTALDVVKNTSVYDTLSQIPNTDGFRYSSSDKQRLLIDALFAMTSDTAETPVINVISTHFEKPRFLKSIIYKQIIEGDNLQNHFKDTNPRHNVARAQLEPYDIHFKQKPSHPMMEYAIHSLSERMFGRGTPAVELLRFEIGGKAIPVLASTTLGDYSLKKGFEKQIPLDPASLTEHLFTALLTKPGDGRASNYVITKDGALICIDNDISFVEPRIRKGFFLSKTQFSCSLFCLDTELHPSTLEAFSTLSPELILYGWILDLEDKEKSYIKLFSDQEQKDLYNEDRDNRFHSHLLLKEGKMIALYLQWIHLQNFIAHHLKETLPRSQYLLKEIVTLRDEDLYDKNIIGQKLFEAYTSKNHLPLFNRLEAITKEKESLPTPTAQLASLGKTPQFEVIQKRKEYGIQEAKEEILAVQLKQCSDEVSLIQEGRIIHADLRNVGTERGSLILKALHFLLRYQKPPERVTLIGSDALTGETLVPFLGNELTFLNLSYSKNLTQKDLIAISKCPNLKSLYLSCCTGIRNFEEWRLVNGKPLLFPQLEEVHLEECDLQTLRIEAHKLKTLQGKGNPNLKNHEIRISLEATVILEKEFVFPKMTVLPFGPNEWLTYFGEIGPIYYPDFPTLVATLMKPCPFWEGKKIYETHLLVFIPQKVNGKRLTLNTLEDLIKDPQKGHKTKYKEYDCDIKNSVGKKNFPSHWILITKDLIPKSTNIDNESRKILIQKHVRKSGIPYEVPRAIEAAIAISTHHVQAGKILCEKVTNYSIFCREIIFKKEFTGQYKFTGGYGGSAIEREFEFKTVSYLMGVGKFSNEGFEITIYTKLGVACSLKI